jgi:aryl-alcohol dehydrogenase-like predicted oxidoreductase
LETRLLGSTGLKVSAIGGGLAALAQESLDDLTAVERTLSAALDSGINFLDTAECYLDSEEMLGRAISHRRDEFFLATKCGHTRGAEQDAWSVGEIAASVEESLRLMRTDHVDLLQLHTCGLDVLERGEAIEAVQRAKESGKTRFIGYSGDNEAARWAVDSGMFDTLQLSFNLADQRPRLGLLASAKKQGVGTIIKRSLANAVWGAAASPTAGYKWGADYGDEYWRRAQALAAPGPIAGLPDDGVAVSLGFVFAHPEVDIALVGTRNPDHMRSNIALMERGVSIPDSALHELYRRWDDLDDDWVSLG